MKKLLAILFVLAMVACVMTGCGGDTTTTTTESKTTTTTTAATTTTTEADTTVTTGNTVTYEDILAELGIVHMETFVGLETASYVGIVNGIVDCQDYGYEGDIVKKLVQTSYISVEGYTEDNKKLLEDTMKSAFSAFEDIDCVTVTYDMGTRYFKVRVLCVDLDKAENVSAVTTAGLLSESTGVISMSKSDVEFINLGYVKK